LEENVLTPSALDTLDRPGSPISVWDKTIPPEKNIYFWDGEPKVIPPTVSPSRDKPTCIDLFCGCGGFSEGFRQAGFEAVLGVDIHKPSVDTFRYNHPSATVILGDMRKLSDDKLRDAITDRSIDVITAGVPCQGFSLNNRKRWDEDDRNFLFREFIRAVRLFKPKFVVLENVSGLAMAASGAFKKAISEAVTESGYRVQFALLNAAEYGVPQRRQRVFFVGYRDDFDFRWPEPTHHGSASPFVTVWQAIGDLPQIGPNEERSAYDQPLFSEFQKRMRGDQNVLLNHQAPNHPADVIEKIRSTAPGKPIYPKFKQRIRLHPDSISPTQVSGGIRPQFQFGHPTMARGLTIRERCRLQSFPDHYLITGGLTQGRVQTGNAVPPLLARALAVEILAGLKGETSQSTRSPSRSVQAALFP
jgi:DNA (cytosine-5)-methyltransferase 1